MKEEKIIGLIVWAQSYCRSTLSFYEGLANSFKVPLKVLVWKKDTSLRTSVGFSDNEFSHIEVRFIENNELEAAKALNEYKDWHHIFGTYQKGYLFRKMLIKAKRLGCNVAVASEAPCNMASPPKSILKAIYISIGLPYVVVKQIRASDYIINLSGDKIEGLISIGWTSDKIIKCGYYPPPLIGSNFCSRDSSHWENFRLLMTGRHEWQRNPMVLLYALNILKERGISCATIITQDGPIKPKMMHYAKSHKLDVEFAGFVPYEKLIHLYQNCSCFIATGRAEPWGIRVNDALHCGSPLLLSEGMGSVKLVYKHNCGLSYSNNNPIDLADKLQLMITDKNSYLEIARNVKQASDECLPYEKAKKIVSEIRTKFPSWK